LLRTADAELIGLAPHAVGLRLLDAGGVALHPDAELVTEVKELLVGEPQFLRQFVDSWVLGQRGVLVLSIGSRRLRKGSVF
jgi:hypothetical protein